MEDLFEESLRSAKRQLKEMDASIDRIVREKPAPLSLRARLSKWFI